MDSLADLSEEGERKKHAMIGSTAFSPLPSVQGQASAEKLTP